jgi:hypothetical protein
MYRCSEAFGESSHVPLGEDLLLSVPSLWAEDVSDDVAIRKTRIKAWANDIWNDLANLSWVKKITNSLERREQMENPRCWCRDCVPGRPLPQFMLSRVCELFFVEKG